MSVCVTVDVEDWYDGMAEMGHSVPRPPAAPSGLETLSKLLTAGGVEGARLTLFVVGKYASTVGSELVELAGRGHEVASHGPDHGRLPEEASALEDWLRRGKDQVEAVAQRPVAGFRSPRFDVPRSMSLGQYRETLARAGFDYVSDRRRVGPGSSVHELPVSSRWRVPLGGGSYQRLLPKRVVLPLATRAGAPPVLYYHSYDFGVGLPTVREDRSAAVARQVIGRGRIPAVFTHVLLTAGSITCREACRGL